MEYFEGEWIVSGISNALFMPRKGGTPIHKDRPTHGFAFNVGCTSEYRFDSGEVLTCHSEELIYLPKGSNYTAKRSLDGESATCGVYAINFLVQTEQTEFRPFVVRVKGVERATSLFSRAANAWAKKEIGYYEECMSDLYGIVRLLKTEQKKYTSYEKSRVFLQPALDYIGENFLTETIEISRLADLCGVSEPYLRRMFQRAFSTSPAVYIRDLRIKYAKDLLLSGEYTVAEVASLSGFNDLSYFSREFKKCMGVSPKEYK